MPDYYGDEPKGSADPTAVEEGACERLARMLFESTYGNACTDLVFKAQLEPNQMAETFRKAARYLLAHASELRDILSSVQEVK
jgi:hypothetical protein